jgi:hypothetical protein
MATTSPIPSSTTFLPPKHNLLVEAKLDLDEFKRATSLLFEGAGLKEEAFTLDGGTWCLLSWPEISRAHLQQGVSERDKERYVMALEIARDHLIVLLALYEVWFEWNNAEQRMMVVDKRGEVGVKMKAPPRLLRHVRRQHDEENRS